ncbi:MAG: OmpA family protein [Deltaproteobacteria bacterium]|nr:OmpA family protein [Deltaproteobacteria bacterium]MBI3386525.1 OmpA family protein [Deltaproteobacteria bacterium]
MKRSRTLLASLSIGLLAVASSVRAAEGPYIGVDIGYAKPTNDAFLAHAEEGVAGNPFAGYMFNKYLGVQAQLLATTLEPDNDSRPNIAHRLDNQNQMTTVLGGAVGPRLSLPLGDLFEFYATAQGGYFAGVSGSLTHSAPGFSVGGGLDYNLTPQVAVGVSGRWNRAYMSPKPDQLIGQQPDQQGPSDAQWLTGGISMKYSFNAPPPAPKPAPVVAEAPAPPPPAPMKKKIVLRGVHFDTAKWNIRADAKPILDEAISTLKENGDVNVSVEGHTDSRGGDAYNQHLSEQRANSVAEYLEKGGVPKSRLVKIVGFGEANPVATNKTADGMQQNRRVELNTQ